MEKNKFVPGEIDAKLAQIVSKYYPLMMYIAKGILKDQMLAEDATQEALIKIVNNIHKLVDVLSLETKMYIAKIIKTTSLNILKKRSRETDTHVHEDLLETIPDPNSNVLDNITAQEAVELMKKIILSLPKIYQDVAILYVLYEKDHTEIAELLGIKPQVSWKRLSRAKKMIREKLSVGESDGE